jgi:hypothetical protein
MTTFSTTRTSRIHMIVTMVIVVTLFEMPALHLLLLRSGLWVHAAILAVNIWAIVWFLGDRRAMVRSAHALGDDALAIHLGNRWRGSIAYAQIAGVRRIDRRDPAALRISPSDTPNVELTLRAPATLTSYYGIKRSSARLQLFVDEPDAFVAAIDAIVTPKKGAP